MLVNSRHFGRTALLLLGALTFLGSLPARAQEVLAPLALTADREGRTLYVAEASANRIAVFDSAAGKVTRTIALPAAPGGVALAADGATLYVTCGSRAGVVAVIQTASGQIIRTLETGHTPVAPVLSPDGRLLYVCCRFDNSVRVIDLAAGREVAVVPALREPVAAAATPDGAFLLVANLLPEGTALDDVVSCAVSVIDLRTRQNVARIALPNGSTGAHGIALSPDGKYAYVTHTLGRFQLPTTQLERGWMNTNALSILDVGAKKLSNTVLLDDVDQGAANPWGVACTADGRQLCITHAGTHELSLIDRAALHARLDRVAAGQHVNSVSLSAADVPNDLSFLVGLRQRVRLAGNGPRGLVIAGGKAWAAEYFSDSLGVIDLAQSPAAPARSIALGPPTPQTPARKGEMFFNDAALCFQQWQSCASCHPDARVDALNWDLINDGIGNPKNVKSMLLAHKTPPVMSLGVRENAEFAVRSGIRFIQFAVRPEEDARAIDEYLKSLTPVASPRLTRDGKLSAAAGRGKAVFDKAGCASCHSGPYTTSLKGYDLGLGRGQDAGKEFDTPTLIEVWRTAPYLHDGRSRTIRDVLTKDNPKDQHGATSGLNQEELSDLIEYVLSL